MDYKALIACLGNPGPEYAANRHNFGFMVADHLLQLGNERKSMRLQQLENTPEMQLWSLHLAGAPHLLLKPLAYMNRSGRAVSKVAGRHALTPDQIIVLHDELDLPLGRIKLRQGGSTNGHRGLESIVEHLGGAGYWRVRLGIGRPAESWQVRDWVLEDFSTADMEVVDTVVGHVAKGLDLFSRKGSRFAVQYLHSLATAAPNPAVSDNATDAGSSPEKEETALPRSHG